jgi:hypothetical protein
MQPPQSDGEPGVYTTGGGESKAGAGLGSAKDGLVARRSAIEAAKKASAPTAGVALRFKWGIIR